VGGGPARVGLRAVARAGRQLSPRAAPEMLRPVGLALAALLLVAAIFVYRQPDNRPTPELGPVDSGLTGEQVAQRYCQSCHALPAVDQLPKETWPFVIQWMGNYLGYKKLYGPFGPITTRRLIPDEPLVSTAEMTRLGRYYITGAPTQQEFRHERGRPPPLERYAAAKLAEAGDDGEIVTLVHVDEQRGHLYVGTENDRKLRIFDRDLVLQFVLDTESAPIHVVPRDRGLRLTLAGDFDRDRRRGRVVDIAFDDDDWNGMRMRTLASGLHRSTESHTADLDGDGRDDLVVVSFGDFAGPGYGRVSVLWASEAFDERYAEAGVELAGEGRQLLPGAFEEQLLLDRAGGLGAQIVDLDEDGRLDVVVLATQGNNELVVYLGRGERRFERHVLASEHVSFGYNSFEVVDVDLDGHLDLVVVNGNNMEMSRPPLRFYHGVRVWLGDGQLGFHEAFSFPMYGALTAVTRDLDGDGDVDIAVNAFYPNWRDADPETLTLLENVGGLEFEARTLEGEHWGRWLRIAAGDLDGDGAVELFLGGGNVPGGGLSPERPRQWERYRRRLARVPAVLVLEPR